MVELVQEIDRAIYNPVWQQVRIPAPWGDDGETLGAAAPTATVGAQGNTGTAQDGATAFLTEIAAKAMGLEPEEVPN